MKHLTQKELKEMMILSYQQVEREKDEINKINVFPVPDQDTGNNLAKTLLGIKESIEGKEFKDLDKFSETVLDGALTNAQGNAGVIYTGFLAGFLPQLKKNSVDIKRLAQAFEKGAERARESIQEPKEGTILDVMEAAASAVKEKTDKAPEMIEVFENIVQKSSKALLETREKMEIFKKANVVDAGGLGFLIILESFLEALKSNGKIKEKERRERTSEKIKRFIQVISHRYEVVSLSKNPRFSQKEIKEKLKKIGNCLDVVQIKNKIKIHIHTDYPEEVKNFIRELGELQSLRVEDMSNEVVGEESLRTVSIGIITDSQALLLPKIIDRYQITTVPFTSEQPKKLEKEFLSPITPPSPKEYLDIFKEQLEKYQSLLCITSSSRIFSSFNNAMKAKKMLYQPKKVFVLDSLNVSTGQSLLVLKAIELIQEQREMDEIISFLRKLIPNIHSYIGIKNLRGLERFDKITDSQVDWIKKVNNIIKLKPIIEIKNGTLKKREAVLASDIKEAIVKKILKGSKRERGRGEKIRAMVGYTDNREEAEQIKKELKEKIKAEIPFIGLTPPGCPGLVTNNIIVSWTVTNKTISKPKI